MEGCAAKLLDFIKSSQPYAQVGMGVLSGWLTGYLMMKIGKIAITVLGGVIILVKIADIEGIIHVNWSNVKQNVENFPKPLTNFTFGNAIDTPSNIQNFSISFIGGSLIGIGCS